MLAYRPLFITIQKYEPNIIDPRRDSPDLHALQKDSGRQPTMALP